MATKKQLRQKGAVVTTKKFEQRVNTNKNEKNVLTRKKIKILRGRWFLF